MREHRHGRRWHRRVQARGAAAATRSANTQGHTQRRAPTKPRVRQVRAQAQVQSINASHTCAHTIWARGKGGEDYRAALGRSSRTSAKMTRLAVGRCHVDAAAAWPWQHASEWPHRLPWEATPPGSRGRRRAGHWRQARVLPIGPRRAHVAQAQRCGRRESVHLRLFRVYFVFVWWCCCALTPPLHSATLLPPALQRFVVAFVLSPRRRAPGLADVLQPRSAITSTTVMAITATPLQSRRPVGRQCPGGRAAPDRAAAAQGRPQVRRRVRCCSAGSATTARRIRRKWCDTSARTRASGRSSAFSAGTERRERTRCVLVATTADARLRPP
jgi:hypothetical protein